VANAKEHKADYPAPSAGQWGEVRGEIGLTKKKTGPATLYQSDWWVSPIRASTRLRTGSSHKDDKGRAKPNTSTIIL
jgi:hypothetical protein